MISKGQQEVTSNRSNNENGFENLYPSINFIQSLTGSYAEYVHRLFKSLLENQEEPRCIRNLNPVIKQRTRTTEDHADLYLKNKNNFFFEKQPESSDEENSSFLFNLEGCLWQT